MDIGFQDFYWGCPWESTYGGVRETRLGRGKRWTMMSIKVSTKTPANPELEWLFWIVPIRGKEFECPGSSTGQPLERSCLWEWGHHLGWVEQLPLTKDDIPGSWRNECLLPGCGHHVAHTAFLHKLFITLSETPVSSSLVNYLGLLNSVSLM